MGIVIEFESAGQGDDIENTFRAVSYTHLFLEFVTEYAVDEVLDTGICPAPVAFRDDVFHCLDTCLLYTSRCV